MGLEASARQEFGELVVHTPHATSRYELPWTFSTFDYRELCILLWEQADAKFETAKVNGRTGEKVHTDRGDVSAPLIVDARLAADPRLGRRLSADALSRAGSRFTRTAARMTWRSGSTAATSPPDTGGASPARDEQRIGVGHSIRASTSRTRRTCSPTIWSSPGALPGQLDPAQASLRDRGRGLLRRRLRRVFDRRGDQDRLLLRDQARRRAAGGDRRAAGSRGGAPQLREFVDAHEWKFRWMLRAQRLLPGFRRASSAP